VLGVDATLTTGSLLPLAPFVASLVANVIGVPMEAVGYLNGRYVEGITSSQVLLSPATICRFLEAEPGVIAYVLVADVDQTCKVLLILEPPADDPSAGKASPDER
jgi:hypothetical protein